MPALEALKRKGTAAKAAEVLTRSFIQSVEYSTLITVINTVLEKALSPELVIDFRAAFFARRKRLARALAAALARHRCRRDISFDPAHLYPCRRIVASVPSLFRIGKIAKGCRKRSSQSQFRNGDDTVSNPITEINLADHCGDAAQSAEAQSGITDRRRSRQSTFDFAACKIRSMLVTSIGSSPTPRAIETPPGRSPLNVAATVFPPDAVIRMTFAPPSACRAAAGSAAALSM
jgi:hypothetical protein